MIVGASCTAELIQDDPGGLAARRPSHTGPALDLPSYQKKENWGAAETFYQLVRAAGAEAARPCGRRAPRGPSPVQSPWPDGPGISASRRRDRNHALAGSHRVSRQRHRAAGRLARRYRAPARRRFQHRSLPGNRETAAAWLEQRPGQPAVRTVPIGIGATRDFIRRSRAVAGVDPGPALAESAARLPWWSRSVDSTYLTGKRVFIFGDATHAIAAARVASEELGFEVVGLGAYNREFARDVRAAAEKYGLDGPDHRRLSGSRTRHRRAPT